MTKEDFPAQSAERPRPRPAIDRLSKPFWDGASRHELVIQKCRACGHYVHPPFPECTACRSADLDFVAVSGRGTIHQRAIIRSPIVVGFEHEVPYVCAMVELAEQAGLVVAGNLVDAAPEDAIIGRAVEATFVTESDGFTRPVFRLSGGTAK